MRGSVERVGKVAVVLGLVSGERVRTHVVLSAAHVCLAILAEVVTVLCQVSGSTPYGTFKLEFKRFRK